MRALRRIDQRYFDWLLAVVLGVGGIVEMTGLEDTRGPLVGNLALSRSSARPLSCAAATR